MRGEISYIYFPILTKLYKTHETFLGRHLLVKRLRVSYVDSQLVVHNVTDKAGVDKWQPKYFYMAFQATPIAPLTQHSCCGLYV